MSKQTEQIEAEAAYAQKAFRERAATNRKAQEILHAETRPVTIRLSIDEIANAQQQAAMKGLRYQTYIKMLLHEALTAARSPAVEEKRR